MSSRPASLFLVFLLLVLSGCQPVRYLQIRVPRESAACWRECKTASYLCREKGLLEVVVGENGRNKFEWVARTTVGYPRGEQYIRTCEYERMRCLRTCDDARWVETPDDVATQTVNWLR